MFADVGPQSKLGLNKRQYLIVGIVSSGAALVINSVINAISPLYFVGGLLVAGIAPEVFGLLGVIAGIQLFHLEETRRGVSIVLGGLLATVTGALYGLVAVF